MNEPQDTAIEQVETEPPESADSDLSDEALDRPHGGGEFVEMTSPLCLCMRSIGR